MAALKTGHCHYTRGCIFRRPYCHLARTDRDRPACELWKSVRTWAADGDAAISSARLLQTGSAALFPN